MYVEALSDPLVLKKAGCALLALPVQLFDIDAFLRTWRLLMLRRMAILRDGMQEACRRLLRSCQQVHHTQLTRALKVAIVLYCCHGPWGAHAACGNFVERGRTGTRITNND